MPKVKAAQFVINKDPRRPSDVHLVVRDTKRRLWERFSTMPPGEWSEIPLPDEPKPAVKPGRKRPDSKPRS